MSRTDAGRMAAGDGSGARCSAVLLLGPTGAGKTPLGEFLEAHGLWGRRCVHFDFGQCLRDAVAGGEDFRSLGREDVGVLRRALLTGRLLEDDEFHIAEKILQAVLAARRAGPQDLVILNGLPRHVGQARALEERVGMRAVVYLECTPETVRERIRRDSGGDRGGRVDDSLDFIRAKLATFEARTLPLLDHYGAKGVQLLSVMVGVETTPETIWRELQSTGAA